MADTTTITTPAPTTPITKDSAEGKAALTAMVPSMLPDKFKNADGTANLPLLIESYKSLETKQSQGASKVEPKVEAEPGVDLNAAFSQAKTGGAWKTAQEELAADGKISETTRATLRKQHNADDNMIDGMADGFRLQREAVGRRLSAAVGGAENLNKVIAWAKENMGEAEVQNLRGSLEGANGPLIARGLLSEMQSKTVTNSPTKTSSGEPRSMLDVERVKDSANAIVPFASHAEMIAAFRDPRQKYDLKYQRWTAERMNASKQQ